MSLLAPPVPGTTEAGQEIEKPGWFWMLLWCLLVLGVQPWSARAAAPQGTTGSTNSMLKGALLIAVFLLVLAATKPGFRTRISPATNLYVVYVLFASATAFLLTEPNKSWMVRNNRSKLFQDQSVHAFPNSMPKAS